MTRIMRTGLALLGSFAAVAAAHADVTGSYDGTITGKKLAEPIAAAAVFTESDTAVTGTVALPADLETFGGEYLVMGTATPKRVKVTGIGLNGVTFKYRGKISGTSLSGKAKFKGGAGKLKGKLALTLNPVGDGASCDAVYTANQTFFEDEVLDVALFACQSCHAPGLQAESTRLRVDPGDPLGTARTIAPLVDSANPSMSRILEKPLNVLPHGGGLQLQPGSTEAQILTQWVNLVAAAACN